jgi:cobalt-zinc-cadmium efflux system outer membrane protein
MPSSPSASAPSAVRPVTSIQQSPLVEQKTADLISQVPTPLRIPGRPSPPSSPGASPGSPESITVPPPPAPGNVLPPGVSLPLPPPPPGRLRIERQTPEPVRPLPADGANLEEIVQLALANSPNLREAARQVAAAEGQAIQAGLYPNPTINAMSPQNAGSQSQYAGYLTQEFVTAGKLRLSRAAARRAVQQAELRLQRTRYDLLTNVRSGFYRVLVGQQRVEVLRNLVSVITKSRESAEKLFRGGLGTRTDALLLQIEQDRATLALENAEVAVAALRRDLAAIIGLPQTTILRVKGDLVAPLPNFEYEALRRGVVTRNALAEIARVEIARNRILLDRAIVEPIPNVVALGGFQYQLERIHDQGIWTVTMNVPIFNRNQGNIRTAQANIAVASQQYRRVQNELSSQVAVALGNFRQAQQRVEYYERQILPRARDIQNIAAQAYAQGEFDFLRLLATQRTLLETNLAYVNAQEERWTAAAQIAGLLQLDQFP